MISIASPDLNLSKVLEPSEGPEPLLQAIRRKEAEVKRRLAAEREAAEAVLAEAERQGSELLSAAEIEGRHLGEAQRQAAQVEAEQEAQATVAQARAESQVLERVGEQQMAAAVARAVEIVIGGSHETQDGSPANRGPQDTPCSYGAHAPPTRLRAD